MGLWAHLESLQVCFSCKRSAVTHTCFKYQVLSADAVLSVTCWCTLTHLGQACVCASGWRLTIYHCYVDDSGEPKEESDSRRKMVMKQHGLGDVSDTGKSSRIGQNLCGKRHRRRSVVALKKRLNGNQERHPRSECTRVESVCKLQVKEKFERSMHGR